ncbi:transposase [Streptomyces sp. NPDC002547]
MRHPGAHRAGRPGARHHSARPGRPGEQPPSQRQLAFCQVGLPRRLGPPAGICPQGAVSREWRPLRISGHEYTKIKLAKADCLACPIRPQCTTSANRPRAFALLPTRQLHQAQMRNRLDQTTTEWQRRTTQSGPRIEGPSHPLAERPHPRPATRQHRPAGGTPFRIHRRLSPFRALCTATARPRVWKLWAHGAWRERLLSDTARWTTLHEHFSPLTPGRHLRPRFSNPHVRAVPMPTWSRNGGAPAQDSQFVNRCRGGRIYVWPNHGGAPLDQKVP